MCVPSPRIVPTVFNCCFEQLKRIDFTLDSLLDSQIPLEMKPPLNERVQRLVAKWAAVLIATLPIMRWGWQKDGFLTYLSGHNGRLLVHPVLPRSVFTDFAYTFPLRLVSGYRTLRIPKVQVPEVLCWSPQ